MREIRLLDDTLLRLHDVGEAFSDHIVREQDYFEKEVLEYISDKHPVQDIILDVGANIGNHTAYFAQYLEYSGIHCFEPVIDNFDLLQLNTAPYPNIFLYNAAVGDNNDMLKMRLNRGNMGAGEVSDDGDTEVLQIVIDEMYFSAPVTLMKIDVEWYEPQVLSGARNLIKTHKPLILIEDTKEQYMGLINRMGYQLEIVWPEHKTYLYRSDDAVIY